MPRDNKYMYIYGVCLLYVCCSDWVGYVAMFVVYRPLLKIVDFWSLSVEAWCMFV